MKHLTMILLWKKRKYWHKEVDDDITREEEKTRTREESDDKDTIKNCLWVGRSPHFQNWKCGEFCLENNDNYGKDKIKD